MSGIKQVTDEVKKRVNESIEPMQKLTNQTKEFANSTKSKFKSATEQMKAFKNASKLQKLENSFKTTQAEADKLYNEFCKLSAEKKNMASWKIDSPEYEKLSQKIEKTELAFEKTQTKANNLKTQIKELENINVLEKSTNNASKFLSKIKEFIPSLNKAKTEINDIKNASKMEQLQNSFRTAQMEADRLYNKFCKLSAEKKNMASWKTDSPEYQRLNDKISKTEIAFEKAQTKANNLKLKMEEIGNNNGVKKQEKKVSKISQMFELAKNKASSFAKAMSSAVMKGFKNLSNSTKTAGKDLSNTFNKGIKNIKNFAIGLLSIRTAWTGVTKAMSSYLQYDTALQESIDNCWSALGSLLAPLLEYVVGLFYKLVSYVVAFVQALTGVNLVARANAKAINNQTGATKKLKKAQDEANSSLDEFHTISKNNNDDSDSGSGNDLKPITVDPIDLSLDDILKKIFNYDWYKVGMELGKKINEGLRKINWDFIQKLAVALGTDLGNLLNGLVDGLDWNLIGKTIAEGFNTAIYFLNSFFKTFNWDNLGKSLGTGINGMINNLDWKVLGELLARKFSSLFQVLSNMLITIDWKKLGKSLADSVTSMFNTMDWDAIFMTFVNSFNGIFTTLNEFLKNVNWGKIAGTIMKSLVNAIDNLDFEVVGESLKNLLNGAIDFMFNAVKEFNPEKIGKKLASLINNLIKAVENTDWKKLGKTFSDGFKKSFELLKTFLKEVDWGKLVSSLVKAICEFLYSIDWIGLFKDMADLFLEIGKALLEGLWAGIKEAVKQKLKFIKTTIVDPIVKRVKEVFGIHSPSKVFAEIGKALIEGLWQGVESLKNWLIGKWASVKNWFTEIKGKVSTVFTTTKKWVKDKVKNVKNWWGDVKLNISSKITTTKAKVKNWWGDIKSWWGDKKLSVKVKLGEITGNVKGIINSVIIRPLNRKLKSVPVLKKLSIPELEKGGVLFNDSIVRVAEYQGAKSNPEIVSPKNMMREVFLEALNESNANRQPQEIKVNVTGETKLKGNDLVITYDKAKKSKGYNGGNNPSFLY